MATKAAEAQHGTFKQSTIKAGSVSQTAVLVGRKTTTE